MFVFIFFFFLVFPPSSYALQAHCHWTNNWTQDSPATQNVIKRTTDNGDSVVFYALPEVNDLLDATVQEGVAYTYQVFAQNVNGISDGSNSACATFFNGLVPVFPPILPVVGNNVMITAPDANTLGIQYQIDGVNYGSENTIPPFSLVLADSSVLVNGPHTITALMRNANGIITTSSQTFTVQNSVPPLIPLVAYEMDEGSGNIINDSSGKNNNATMVNMIWVAPGQNSAGSALQGTPTGKVTTPVNSHGTIRTYTAWTKRTGPGGSNFGRIFDKRTNGAEVELLYNDEGPKVYRFIRVWSGGVGHWTIPQPSANVWHHIAVMYDSSLVTNNPKIYLDGVEQIVTRTSAPNGTVLVNTDPYVVANRGAGDRSWAGQVDKFRIYDGLVDILSTM